MESSTEGTGRAIEDRTKECLVFYVCMLQRLLTGISRQWKVSLRHYCASVGRIFTFILTMFSFSRGHAGHGKQQRW